MDLIWLAVVFLILALVFYILGARGVAGFSMEIAKNSGDYLCNNCSHYLPVRVFLIHFSCSYLLIDTFQFSQTAQGGWV